MPWTRRDPALALRPRNGTGEAMFRTAIRLDHGRGFGIERLHFLTDGVYAIVMTLLVLELKIPENLAPGQILPALIATAPKFGAFAISFCAAACGWAFSYLGHSLMTRSNFSHMIFSFISLMAAAVIPFASAVMGSYPDSPWGYVAYSVTIGTLSGMLALDMAINGNALVRPGIDRRIVATLALSGLGCTLVAAAGATLLAFWSPRLMLGVIVVVSVLIWIDYYYVAAWIGRELAQLDAAEQATPISSDFSVS